MHHLTDGKLLVSKLDIGIPGLMPPKTGIFAHQMIPVDCPTDFETKAKDLIERYEITVTEWKKATSRVKKEK